MTVHERKSFYKEQTRLQLDDMTLTEASQLLASLNESTDYAITWATHWKPVPVAPSAASEE